MCLLANAKTKRNFKRRNQGEKITAYKVYKVYQKTSQWKLCSVFFPNRFDTIKNHGWIVSNRTGGTTVGSDCCDIAAVKYNCAHVNRGIHVYLNIADAFDIVMEKGCVNRVIVPVQCRVEDLIGIDSDEKSAAFTKVYINKENFRQAVK